MWVPICCDALQAASARRRGCSSMSCPHIDELGAAGMTFRHAYCTIPLCVTEPHLDADGTVA